MDNLNTSILSRVPLPLPSFDEHKSIVEAVWLANDSIDALLARIQVGIKRLQEYRTALISTAVTGKIDVREST